MDGGLAVDFHILCRGDKNKDTAEKATLLLTVKMQQI